MSQNSSTSVNQPQRRNDNDQRPIGTDRENQIQMIPLANLHPPSSPIARRILVIQNLSDIVRELSEFSRRFRQPIYILTGRGYITQFSLTTIPGPQQLDSGLFPGGQILYLGGWFQPTIMQNAGLNVAAPFSRSNGILYVSLSGLAHGVSIANSLIASGSVEVFVVFVCGPGSGVQPDAPGGLAAPIRIVIPSSRQEHMAQ